MEQYSLTFEALSLTPKKIYEEMGYRHEPPDEYIVGLTSSLLSEISDFAAPLYTFRIYDGTADDSAAVFSNGTRLQTGAILASLLQGAEQIAVFAATAGTAFQAFQEAVKREGDLLKTYVVDAIGSCIAESAGDCMEAALETRIGALKHTKRFSPGYCGWHLSGQKELFKLLDNNPCGIELSNVCLMTPIKSISGVIGIGHAVKENIYGCRYCELETCYKRKK
ncbi:MAG: hypothetical protein LBR06_05195 [Bacteroidales bacterium]|jgi:hypothetical protein|nr:hypothetical protein [Bacteroidales bacterium]